MTRKPPRLSMGDLSAAQYERLAAWVIFACALGAMVVSFTQVAWTARVYLGLATWAAVVFAVIVDGIATVLAGLTSFTAHRELRLRVYVWATFIPFIALSIGANFLHALEYGDPGRVDNLPPFMAGAGWAIVLVLAAVPPLGATIGMHTYAWVRRHGVLSDRAAPAQQVRAETAHRTPPIVRATEPGPARTPRTTRAPSAVPRAPSPTVPAADGTWERRALDLLGTTPDRSRGWKARITRQLENEGYSIPHRSNVERFLTKHDPSPATELHLADPDDDPITHLAIQADLAPIGTNQARTA